MATLCSEMFFGADWSEEPRLSVMEFATHA
jgi:hypothetical protein